MSSPRLALLLLLLLLTACGGADAASSVDDKSPTNPTGGADGGGDGASSKPATRIELGCKGAVTPRHGTFDEDRGTPVAAFPHGDEDWVFFSGCMLVRVDPNSGKSLGESRVCRNLESFTVTRGDDGFWLAGARDLARPDPSKPAQALDLVHVGNDGRAEPPVEVLTAVSVRVDSVAAGARTLAIVAVVERVLPSRNVYFVSKSGLATLERNTAPYATGAPQDFAFVDKVRVVEGDVFVGFTAAGNELRFDGTADFTTSAAPFAKNPESTCISQSSPFKTRTAFLEDDDAFVALTMATSSCHLFGPASAPDGSRYGLTVRRASKNGEIEELAALTKNGEDLRWLNLCTGSRTEASLLHHGQQGGTTLARHRYDGAPVPPYTFAENKTMSCPVAFRGGYLVASVDYAGKEPARTTWLACE